MPDTTAELRAAVTEQVLAAWRDAAAAHRALGPEVESLFTVGTDLLAHGKRLRAAFAAAGWRGHGGEPLHPAELRMGGGLELFQMAALVHDDLMDGSLTRRGRPAAHRQLASHHVERALVGSPDRFGDAGAILLGDLLLVSAQAELAAALALAPAPGPARAVVDEMMAEVTVGQYLDMWAQSAPWSDDPSTDLDRALRVIRSKSARYSVEHPLVLGAALAGAGPAALDRLRAVGLPIGEAFQLRDDVLGVFGDPVVTGKPAGDDLREGKRTVLLALAMEGADEGDRRRLRDAVGRDDLDDADIAALRALLVRSGATSRVEDLIDERYRTGLAALDTAGLPTAQREVLAALARAAVERVA